MKKLFLVVTLLLFLLIPTTSMARTDFFLNIGLGIPLPVFVAPAPAIVASQPVIVVPPPVIVSPPVFYQYQPSPVYYGPPGWYKGKHRGWYKHYR